MAQKKRKEMAENEEWERQRQREMAYSWIMVGDIELQRKNKRKKRNAMDGLDDLLTMNSSNAETMVHIYLLSCLTLVLKRSVSQVRSHSSTATFQKATENLESTLKKSRTSSASTTTKPKSIIVQQQPSVAPTPVPVLSSPVPPSSLTSTLKSKPPTIQSSVTPVPAAVTYSHDTLLDSMPKLMYNLAEYMEKRVEFGELKQEKKQSTSVTFKAKPSFHKGPSVPFDMEPLNERTMPSLLEVTGELSKFKNLQVSPQAHEEDPNTRLAIDTFYDTQMKQQQALLRDVKGFDMLDSQAKRQATLEDEERAVKICDLLEKAITFLCQQHQRSRTTVLTSNEHPETQGMKEILLTCLQALPMFEMDERAKRSWLKGAEVLFLWNLNLELVFSVHNMEHIVALSTLFARMYYENDQLIQHLIEKHRLVLQREVEHDMEVEQVVKNRALIGLQSNTKEDSIVTKKWRKLVFKKLLPNMDTMHPWKQIQHIEKAMHQNKWEEIKQEYLSKLTTLYFLDSNDEKDRFKILHNKKVLFVVTTFLKFCSEQTRQVFRQQLRHEKAKRMTLQTIMNQAVPPWETVAPKQEPKYYDLQETDEVVDPKELQKVVQELKVEQWKEKFEQTETSTPRLVQQVQVVPETVAKLPRGLPKQEHEAKIDANMQKIREEKEKFIEKMNNHRISPVPIEIPKLAHEKKKKTFEDDDEFTSDEEENTDDPANKTKPDATSIFKQSYLQEYHLRKQKRKEQQILAQSMSTNKLPIHLLKKHNHDDVGKKPDTPSTPDHSKMSYPELKDDKGQLIKAAGILHLLDKVWDTLKMPVNNKALLISKYGSSQYIEDVPTLAKVYMLYKQACDCIQNREDALNQLRQFESQASDPRRLFKGNSTARLDEEKDRVTLIRRITKYSQQCEMVAKRLKRVFNDQLLFHGVSYLSKMKNDYSTMLYVLEEKRVMQTHAQLLDSFVQKEKV